MIDRSRLAAGSLSPLGARLGRDTRVRVPCTAASAAFRQPVEADGKVAIDLRLEWADTIVFLDTS